MTAQSHVRDPNTGKPTISFDAAKFRDFKGAYAAAVELKAATFPFEGHEFVIGYAKYLIEYLEPRFNQGSK